MLESMIIFAYGYLVNEYELEMSLKFLFMPDFITVADEIKKMSLAVSILFYLK
jgi:hypothetical protein